MQFSSDSYFSIVADVNDNWARVKGMKNYREEFGIALFRRYVLSCAVLPLFLLLNGSSHSLSLVLYLQ